MAIKMSDAVARQVEDRFDNLSNEFAATRAGFGTQAVFLELGCGQFQGLITDGAATFELGWSGLMDVGTASAGLIAGNTNQFQIDRTAVDTDYSHQSDLTGTSTATPRFPDGKPVPE
jgi:hypothetical protein